MCIDPYSFTRHFQKYSEVLVVELNGPNGVNFYETQTAAKRFNQII
jgi:hypothetical protein